MPIVTFSKFGGKEPVRCEGELVSADGDFVKVSHEGTVYSFKRCPGSKRGWGVGPAKSWRLGEEARKAHCLPDSVRRR